MNGFNELLYPSALESYGVTGFLAILLIFLLPMGLMAIRPELLRSSTRRAAGKGLMLYAIVACIDGATLLIPVMAFYWFAYMTMLFGLPGDQGHVVLREGAGGKGTGYAGLAGATSGIRTLGVAGLADS